MYVAAPAGQTGALLKQYPFGTPDYFGDGYVGYEKDFQVRNPNCAQALFGAFILSTLAGFNSYSKC